MPELKTYYENAWCVGERQTIRSHAQRLQIRAPEVTHKVLAALLDEHLASISRKHRCLCQQRFAYAKARL